MNSTQGIEIVQDSSTITNLTKVNTETESRLRVTFKKGSKYDSMSRHLYTDIVIDSIAIQNSSITPDNTVFNSKFQHCFW